MKRGKKGKRQNESDIRIKKREEEKFENEKKVK